MSTGNTQCRINGYNSTINPMCQFALIYRAGYLYVVTCFCNLLSQTLLQMVRFEYLFVRRLMDSCSCFRMTSDGSLPADKRRNYSSVFNAIARIYKVCTIAYINKTFHCNMCSSKIDEKLAGGGVDHLVEGSHTNHG